MNNEIAEKYTEKCTNCGLLFKPKDFNIHKKYCIKEENKTNNLECKKGVSGDV